MLIGDWKIIVNSFPYDLIATRHDLLAPTRHIGAFDGLTDGEKEQLNTVKHNPIITKAYSLVLENLGSNRSIKDHFHLHLIRLK